MTIREVLSSFIFITLVTIFYSCNYDKREVPEPIVLPVDTVIADTCDADSITYTNFVKTILETNCTAFSDCHGTDAPPGFDYTTYAGIKAKVDSGKFQLRVLELRDMPQDNSPGPDTLDDCTLLKLRNWVDAGAPE